jgi:hypothetical protein
LWVEHSLHTVGRRCCRHKYQNEADRAEQLDIQASISSVEPSVPFAGRLAVTSVAESCSCGWSTRCIQWADVVADTGTKRGRQGRTTRHKLSISSVEPFVPFAGRLAVTSVAEILLKLLGVRVVWFLQVFERSAFRFPLRQNSHASVIRSPVMKRCSWRTAVLVGEALVAYGGQTSLQK